MSRRLAFLSAAALALTIAGCTAQPSADPSASRSAGTTRSASPAASASPGPSSATPADPADSAEPADPEVPGDAATDIPDLPPTDPGPAVGSDGTVQGYDPAAVAAVCVPQVQSAYAEGTVSPDPSRSWRIDGANVAVEWSLTGPDADLTVICVIAGPLDAPEFAYVTLPDL